MRRISSWGADKVDGAGLFVPLTFCKIFYSGFPITIMARPAPTKVIMGLAEEGEYC